MEEAKEETSGVQGDQTCARRFTTRSQVKSCIVDTCKVDHPPWVCEAFKELPVLKRRKLISSTGRCYRCLVAGHHSKECPNAKRCGVNGCTSTSHSSYLHYTLGKTGDWSHDQLWSDATPFRPLEQPHSGVGASQGTGASTNGSASERQQNSREQTHSTRHTEHVSLMILPALISNGNKELRVNVMLDPCSTSSYISHRRLLKSSNCMGRR